MLSLMKNESCMKAVSWDVCSKQQPKLRPWSCGNVFLSAVNHVWGRKQYSSPRISWKVSSPSHCRVRGSAQHGPELCYSQGAWRLGNMTAKSVNCISHRSLNNQQKRIICSQTWSSKVQIRNRIKTPSVQGHLPSFSSVAWRPHSILLSPLTICSPWPWAVPDAWGGGKPTSLRKSAFYTNLRVEVKHFWAHSNGFTLANTERFSSDLPHLQKCTQQVPQHVILEHVPTIKAYARLCWRELSHRTEEKDCVLLEALQDHPGQAWSHTTQLPIFSGLIPPSPQSTRHSSTTTTHWRL